MASELYQDRLEIRIGRTFTKTWPVNDSDDANGDGNTPYDPTGSVTVAEVRSAVGGALIVRFASDGSGSGVPIGTITWDSVGNMTFGLTAAQTALLSPISQARWDAELTDAAGNEWPLLEGPVFITKGVVGG